MPMQDVLWVRLDSSRPVPAGWAELEMVTSTTQALHHLQQNPPGVLLVDYVQAIESKPVNFIRALRSQPSTRAVPIVAALAEALTDADVSLAGTDAWVSYRHPDKLTEAVARARASKQVQPRAPLPAALGQLVTTFVPRRRAGILQISDDLRWGVEVATDRSLTVWELSSGQQQAILYTPLEMAEARFSPDGIHLLASRRDVMKAWFTPSWTELTLPFLGRDVANFSCSTGGLLASAAEFVYLCDLHSGRSLGTLDPHRVEREVRPAEEARLEAEIPLSAWVAVRPDGQELSSCAEVLEETHYWSTYRVERYSLSKAHSLGHLDTVRTGGRPIAPLYSWCGRRLALPLRDGEVLLWDLEKGQALPSLNVRAHGFSFAAENLGLVLKNDATLSLWDLQTGQPVGGYLEVPAAQLLRSSTQHAFTTGQDGLYVWDLAALVRLLSSTPGRICLPTMSGES